MLNISKEILSYTSSYNKTLPCFGPMSKNTIDACSEISFSYKIPIMLIASRRQVDSLENGGGYVENFTTREFVKYVKNKDTRKLILARDHGGPWQGLKEVNQNLSIASSMQSSLESFKEDIKSGFNYIHIDPSIPIGNEKLTQEIIIERLLDLWANCDEYAKSLDKEIYYEFGTEEQNGYSTDNDLLREFLDSVINFGEKNHLKLPTFIVAQTGTKVLETQNIGVFSKKIKDLDEGFIKYIKTTSDLIHNYGFYLKEHNADYLSDQSLLIRPHLGIDASNIAPEFGVIETKSLISLLSYFNLNKDIERFIELCIESKKWEKWMLKNSKANELDKSIICGHYLFGSEEVKEIKNKLYKAMKIHGLDLDDLLKRSIKTAIIRYINLLSIA